METTFLIAGIMLLALLVFGRLLLGKAPEVSDKDSANSPDVEPIHWDGEVGRIQLNTQKSILKELQEFRNKK